MQRGHDIPLGKDINQARMKWPELESKENPSGLDEAKRILPCHGRDIRPKAASDIADIREASALLGQPKAGITERVYRRVGAIAKPTK